MPARPATLLLLASALPRCNPFSSKGPTPSFNSGRSKPYPLCASTTQNQYGKGSVQCEVNLAIDKFISTLQTSLEDGTFESFLLKGPSAPRKRRKNGADDEKVAAMLELQKEKLRGKYKSISGRLVLLQEKRKKKKRTRGKNYESNEDGHAESLHIQATIKYHLATDLAKNWKVNQTSSGQSEVETGLRQIFLTAMGSDIDDHSGVPLSEWGVSATSGINGDFGIIGGELATETAVYKLQLQPRHKAVFVLSKKKPAKLHRDVHQQSSALSHLSHDRAKNVPLLPSSEFFQRLGVTNTDGKPVNGMASKLRQCQKFVEIVGGLVDNVSGNSSRSTTHVRAVDMGCGRGYLTFSLHSHLSDKFGSVKTQGIDRRPKLIEEVNAIAQKLGGPFETLHFVEGAISETQASLLGDDRQRSGKTQHLDVLIALHACDCATDDAIWFGIDRGADIIVTAPCCQHELRPQIDRHAADNPDHPLGDVLRHAIYRERATETVTDALRALLLELGGYKVQVLEFVGGEHTAKNVMIAATRVNGRQGRDEQERRRREIRRRLIDLAQLYGIKRQRLATLMGENVVASEANELKTVARHLSGMPPL